MKLISVFEILELLTFGRSYCPWQERSQLVISLDKASGCNVLQLSVLRMVIHEQIIISNTEQPNGYIVSKNPNDSNSTKRRLSIFNIFVSVL